MAANEQVAQRKLSMLQLTQELRSVSEACRLMGYSRSQFYEIKRAFQTGGLEALLDKPPISGSTPHKLPEGLEKDNRALHRTPRRHLQLLRDCLEAALVSNSNAAVTPSGFLCSHRGPGRKNSSLPNTLSRDSDFRGRSMPRHGLQLMSSKSAAVLTAIRDVGRSSRRILARARQDLQ